MCYTDIGIMCEGRCGGMKFVWIVGSGAVGKMTVGQALMKKTGLRLFHNHMMIEPVIEIFGGYDSGAVNRLRQVVFEEFVKGDYPGMIFTYMWAFDQQSDWDYVMQVSEFFEEHGAEIYCVELVADQAVRLERNRTENRRMHKASKRDTVVAEGRILREDAKYRLVSLEGEIPFKNYIRLDNTNLTPDEAAERIRVKFGI